MKKIILRADADRNIGYGHFIRSLALADMLRNEFDCYFATVAPTPYQTSEIENVCECIRLNDDGNQLESFLTSLNGDEIVVLDNYFYTTEYQKRVKAKGCKLVCIDDMHDKHYVADIVINYGTKDKSLFSTEHYTQLCLGLDYALLRKAFQIPRKIEHDENYIVVSFGGSDPYNLTNSALKIFGRSSKYRIAVITGDKTEINVNCSDNIRVYRNISAEAVCKLFDKCKCAILPASTICLEAISRGTKVISGHYVDNQISFYNYIKKENYIHGIGELKTDNKFDIFSDDTYIENILKQKFDSYTPPTRDVFVTLFSTL